MSENYKNFGKKRYIRLRNDQEHTLEVLQMILCDELREKYLSMDKAKYEDSTVKDNRSKDVLPLSVIIRLGIDQMLENIKSDIRERDRMNRWGDWKG